MTGAAGTVIAVTGDIGAGKSTVSRLFESFGGVLIDADRVVADLWRTPDVVAAARARWGDGILDAAGRVDHGAVAARVFAEGCRAEYDWLLGFLHPLVRLEVERRVRELAAGEWAVAEIPLLFEGGRYGWVTASVFVTAPRGTRLERCRARGWDESEMERRSRFFLPSERRMALADYVIRNDGSLGRLREEVERIYNAIETGQSGGR
ncbi:MAG: dephospho-CoA kinase [Synergistaceae bacterium]|jgi:dephospho-CoA kinase|nr:dephospho-CoA kinase [Synergistaceae bacterium]